MTRFVIDNSVVMTWCFEDEDSAYAEAVLESLEADQAVVPSVWPLELGDVLLVAERKDRLSQAEVARFLALVGALPISVEQESAERMLREIVALARDLRLTAYDASYLDLAMRSGLPIATQDASLLKAAKKCRVPVYKPVGARKKSRNERIPPHS
ncbi:type II toxin-antitoxin system VapC family toxin [Candidatus Sumerlaeota bacterium]|nr:type II toxin-antitoxin system VapC family toxin [Candidatus Sumerlaeota bacterium]